MLIVLGGLAMFLTVVVLPAYLLTLEHQERMLRGVAPVVSSLEAGR